MIAFISLKKSSQKTSGGADGADVLAGRVAGFEGGDVRASNPTTRSADENYMAVQKSVPGSALHRKVGLS